MANTVWKTLEKYGLKGRIVAFVMDNATNNDTMLESIEKKCVAEVHLAAIKLLEVISALTKEESKKAGSQTSKHAYQETVTQEDNHNADCAAAARTEEEDSMESDTTGAHGISPAVFKLRKIVKHVRSSPQRRRAWELTVKISLDGLDAELSEAQLMLILDVRTRWTSTHQMLRHAIHNRDAITRYVESSSDLVDFVLSDLDWEALQMCWILAIQQNTRGWDRPPPLPTRTMPTTNTSTPDADADVRVRLSVCASIGPPSPLTLTAMTVGS
ncbi:hypothetical protein B0H14DRAFT_3482613 [Mycena olivaceomarginata]|nr:hypothetical protein B0H14DRAFT_3482613 [Mycena olivaceomarginata]